MKPVVHYLNQSVNSHDLVTLCDDPDHAMHQSGNVIKDDRTNTLSVVQTDIGPVVIKRYNTKNVWHQVRRNFQISRAINFLKMAHQFSGVGLNIPTSLAVVEARSGRLRGRSWYISRYIESESLIDHLNLADWENRYQAVISHVTGLFAALQQNRLSHGDLKATNLLVHQKALFIIDLDAARLHSSKWHHQRALQKDKRRFLKNWNNLPELKAVFHDRLMELGC